MVAATAQRLNQGETLRNAGRDAEGRDANGTKPTKHEREERATEAGHQQSRMNELSDSRVRSEEHTSELQSLMRISYAVFCLKKKNKNNIKQNQKNTYKKQ